MSRRDPATWLSGLVEARTVTAAAAAVATPEGIAWSAVAGEERPGVPATIETRFDLASETKVFAATLALVLDGSGELPLQTPVGEIFPAAVSDLARRPLEDLLRHRSGLASWVPLSLLCRSREEVLGLLLSCRFRSPRREIYSDLGNILWAFAAEAALGRSYGDLLAERVLRPLDLPSILPSPGDLPGVAASRMDGAKEVALAQDLGFELPLPPAPAPGEPQDGNARFLRSLGIPLPGHAGLFGGVTDVVRFGLEWLAPRRLLSPAQAARALRGGREYGLGWTRRSVRGSSGAALSPAAFGLTGFAGASLWIDPEKRAVFVLLSHRRDGLVNFNPHRRRFHALGAKTLV